MSNYAVRDGETITDVILNATGDLDNWDAFLEANGISDWCPKITRGQQFIIPDGITSIPENISQLSAYPANNNSINEIDGQLSALWVMVQNSPQIPAPAIPSGPQVILVSYIVQDGETITDVLMNSAGTVENWDLMLSANGFIDWVPDIKQGQQILVPITVKKDLNSARALANYPANNHSVYDVYSKINDTFDIVKTYWILTTGFWNDTAVWKDTEYWIDEL